VGSEAFRQELLAQVGGSAGPRHTGEEIRQSTQAKAEGIVREEMVRLHWTGEDLRRRPKGDPQKVGIAARLRRETTMTLAWIAARLGMGVPTHVAHLLYRQDRKEPPSANTLF
jgi:hypothetical protein